MAPPRPFTRIGRAYFARCDLVHTFGELVPPKSRCGSVADFWKLAESGKLIADEGEKWGRWSGLLGRVLIDRDCSAIAG